MKLKKMTDFVWDILEYVHESRNETRGFLLLQEYLEFIQQPLTLGMFIPCDLEGNVLEEPLHYKSFIDYENDLADDLPIKALDKSHEYNQAKKRILFEGFCIKDTESKNKYALYGHSKYLGYWNCHENSFSGNHYKTVEDLTLLNLILTPNAIKQLGL